jgi:6-phosphofructokinase 1
VDKIRDTASSHQRVFLIEVMGRDKGYLALMAGIASGAEVILVPEVETTLEEITETVGDAYIRGKVFAIVMIAEGAKLKVQQVAQYLKDRQVGYEVRVTILGHVQRGGTASAFDRLLATQLGAEAVEILAAGETGTMACLQGGRIGRFDLEEALSQEFPLDLGLYELAKVLAI